MLEKEIKATCPKCGHIIMFKNYWSWVWHNPVHFFGSRRTKCPACGVVSYISRDA